MVMVVQVCECSGDDGSVARDEGRGTSARQMMNDKWSMTNKKRAGQIARPVWEIQDESLELFAELLVSRLHCRGVVSKYRVGYEDTIAEQNAVADKYSIRKQYSVG